MLSPAADYTAALIEGPWRHEFVSANGSRFHVALAGPDQPTRPLVVLLHTFGQFWWSWRSQIEALSAAGYRVAAIDLRGVAASDKPPVGYDIPTRTRDIAGVIRVLGASQAVVVGHGTGGEVAWSMAALQPSVTSAVAALASPHPARVHAPLAARYTAAALRLLTLAQVPMLPERRLRDSDLLARYFTLGAAAPLLAEALARYREVMRIPFAAHTCAEALRWSVRSLARPDGRRYAAAVRRIVTIPALQIQGERDGIVRLRYADADSAALCRNLRYELLPGVGHFLPEEAPAQVSALLLQWLAAQE
ncbi:MAG: alpha/beta hydrolase [Promicromonosporaceae bacterium]|nr:alpha/beta hydrolase [Promicromonosporaceae bacterium]